MPTWMETWLLGCCAWPQAPTLTKGSSVEHSPLNNSSICLSTWCPDLVMTDTEPALRGMVPSPAGTQYKGTNSSQPGPLTV